MLKIAILGIAGVQKGLEQALSETVKRTADLTLQEAKKATPIRSGTARKNWQQRASDKSFSVENRVPYIERLEKGWSRQAPAGILSPTLNAVKGKSK